MIVDFVLMQTCYLRVNSRPWSRSTVKGKQEETDRRIVWKTILRSAQGSTLLAQQGQLIETLLGRDYCKVTTGAPKTSQ